MFKSSQVQRRQVCFKVLVRMSLYHANKTLNLILITKVLFPKKIMFAARMFFIAVWEGFYCKWKSNIGKKITRKGHRKQIIRIFFDTFIIQYKFQNQENLKLCITKFLR